MSALQILSGQRVVPVIEIARAQDAVPLCQALLAGGIGLIEITLRTDAALAAIEAVAKANVPIKLGVGSLSRPEQFKQVKDLGAQFGISPALTPRLIDAAQASGLPMIPGVATAGEALAAFEAGFAVQKFFPAAASGGTEWLKSVAGPLPMIKFVPTGGINAENMMNYLGCPNVLAIGGSWIAPKKLIEAGDWAGITALCKLATQTAGQ
jgi:2-dehydro-3-deoxyphosphogluconate aldolase / (4S)-4-hydroxy-2-oxoglutarate aldolase